MSGDLFLTSLPCDECGAAVFQLTARRKRFCSKACMNAEYHRTHTRGRGRISNSVTITYTDADGRKITKVGFGVSKREARADADSQLPRWFVPQDVYLSTVGSILRSLQRAS